MRENELDDIVKAWWGKVQDKRVVYDSERIQANTEERKERKCLSFALTFIDMKTWIDFNEWARREIV